MSILDLSAELLICISSFLRQVDLLNLSLACKRFNYATEPERFREYTNVKARGRSFVPFIVRLLQRPELRRHVHRLDLKHWITLETYNPIWYKNEQLNREEYMLLTRAAKEAGIIDDIFPYEIESHIIKVAKTKELSWHGKLQPDTWYLQAFGEGIRFSDLSYDRVFCQMLRAGIEDPLVILLLALLSNVRRIFFHGMPFDSSILPYRANVQYRSVRHVTAQVMEGETIWPLAFLDSLFASSDLEVFEASSASSWYALDGEMEPQVKNVRPLSIQPRSLNIKKLELQWSCLKASDLKILLAACPKLKIFRYTSRNGQVGPWSPSPAKMIELLDPFKHALEELWLYVRVDVYEDMDNRPDDLITSLTHMTGLRCLSTVPEIWRVVEENAYYRAENEELDFEHRLSLRLPPNLEQFILEDSEGIAVAIPQLTDLVRNCPTTLPKLRWFHMGCSDWLISQRIRELQAYEQPHLAAGLPPLVLTEGSARLDTVFDGALSVFYSPDTRWFGERYARRQHLPSSYYVQMIQEWDAKLPDKNQDDKEPEDTRQQNLQMEAMLDRFRSQGEEHMQWHSNDYETDEDSEVEVERLEPLWRAERNRLQLDD